MDNSGIISPETHVMHFTDNPTFSDFCTIAETDCSRIVRARRHNQWWVLKCMKDDYTHQPFFQQLLQKEYDLLIRMHHSGIDRPISLEYVEELGPCLVMECIEGVTLDEFQTDRSGRRRIAFQIVETMAYVHSCQVVHRDLKPANIMVTQNGQNVKIIDFGLADADNYAILKQPAGTPRYISPEQLDSHEPDVRNDVYSLGIILDELRLGWPFRHIIRRSTGPIEHRYMGAGELLRAMHRAERLPAWIIVGTLALTIAIAAAHFGFNTHSAEEVPPVADEQPLTPLLVEEQRESPQTLETKQTLTPASQPQLPAQTQATPQSAAPTPTLNQACKASQKRFDQYLRGSDYTAILHACKTEPWSPNRFEELQEKFKVFYTGTMAEIEQIRKDAKANFPNDEAERIYVATNEHFINDYYKPLIAALNEYVRRRNETSESDG